MSQNEKNKLSTKDLVFIAFFAALMAICSWITIPAAVPFTMQTFGVFLTLALLGGRRGTLSILLFILLGAIGIPVFSGFKGGIGVLLGTTGGYIIGFILTALIMWIFEKLFGHTKRTLIVSMLLGLIACYAAGTAWFMIVYMQSGNTVSLMTTLGWCVIPFIIPDLLKIALALILHGRLKKFVPS